MSSKQELEFINLACILAASRLGSSAARELSNILCTAPLDSHYTVDHWIARLGERGIDLERDSVEKALHDIGVWKEEGLALASLGSSKYPEYLSKIYNPPTLLFYQGAWEAVLKSNLKIAIVGSRRAEPIAKDFGFQLGVKLSRLGCSVVSGLALGVDAAAHWGALQASGAGTIAVLGSGLQRIYPRGNTKLYRSILEKGGVVVSQFEPDTPPYPSNFLNRNRIIAGLSKGVVIIQAGDRSGSLATARFAMDEGREVFVIPGSVNNLGYKGSHNLIKNGAYLLDEFNDLCEVFEELKNSQKAFETQAEKDYLPGKSLTALQSEILKILGLTSSMSFDELSARFADREFFLNDLLGLELEGLLIRLPGNYLTLAKRL